MYSIGHFWVEFCLCFKNESSRQTIRHIKTSFDLHEIKCAGDTQFLLETLFTKAAMFVFMLCKFGTWFVRGQATLNQQISAVFLVWKLFLGTCFGFSIVVHMVYWMVLHVDLFWHRSKRQPWKDQIAASFTLNWRKELFWVTSISLLWEFSSNLLFYAIQVLRLAHTRRYVTVTCCCDMWHTMSRRQNER